MKFVTQLILAIVAIIGVVAGITYVSQYYDRARPVPPSAGGGDPATATLTFPVKIVTWDPPTMGEFELHASGHQDFAFSNKNQVPIELGLRTKSCKCSDIEVCVLTPEEAERFNRDAPAEAAAQFGLAQQGALGLICEVVKGRDASPSLQRVKLQWHKLEPENIPQASRVKGDAVVVPPGGSGFVRFDWDGKKTKEGPDRLNIELYMQPREGKVVARDYAKLELPLTFVPALRIMPERIEIDELGPRDVTTAEFVCWSATRAGFLFSAKVLPEDPCVTCEWAPMSEDERLKVSEKYTSRVLAAYRVRVTVRERTEGGKQLDIGPLMRRIALTSDLGDDETNLPMVGMVVGEFIVGSDEDKGKVQLASFDARTGTSKEIVILGRYPEAKLLTDSVKVEPAMLNYVNASLKADGPERWRLLVKVKENCPPVRFPQDASVVLKVAGSQNRQLRIPLRGIAFRR